MRTPTWSFMPRPSARPRRPAAIQQTKPGGQRRATQLLSRLGRGARSPAGLHVDRPRLRRREILVPRGRPGPPDPGLRPDQACRRAIRARRAGGLVARLSLLYGPSRYGREGFFDRALASPASGQRRRPFSSTNTARRSITRTAATLLVRLTESETRGTIHLGGPERLSRFELMSRAAAALGIDPALVRPNRRADVALARTTPRRCLAGLRAIASTSSRTWPVPKSRTPSRRLLQCLTVRSQRRRDRSARSSSEARVAQRLSVPLSRYVERFMHRPMTVAGLRVCCRKRRIRGR